MSKNLKLANNRKIIESTCDDYSSSADIRVDGKMMKVFMKTVEEQHKINTNKQIELETKNYELEQKNLYLSKCAEKFHNENTILKTQQESMKNDDKISKADYKILTDADNINQLREKVVQDVVTKNKKQIDKDMIDFQKNLYGPI